jgi:indolepyruvate ferredoxin oxidoreductase
LTPQNHGDVAELVGLRDLVRGYEDIKLRNVTLYRKRVAAALTAARR